MFYRKRITYQWKVPWTNIMVIKILPSQAIPYPALSLMSLSMLRLHTPHSPTTGEIQLKELGFS